MTKQSNEPIVRSDEITPLVGVKAGVEFSVVAPAGFLILQALKHTSATHDIDLTITSGTDGVHSGPGDPHHTGEAYDVRSHDFAIPMRPIILRAIMAELGWEKFYGFIEALGEDNEHFHFQKAKGTTYTVEDFLASDEPEPLPLQMQTT